MVVNGNSKLAVRPDEHSNIAQLDQGSPNHSAVELTGGGQLAFITHQGKVYTLRITRAGKLILTK